jgi:CheY-like chemotaxis protein
MLGDTKMRVMAVEDDALLLLMLVDILTDFDEVALPFTNADTALAALTEVNPEALVTDIDLPGRHNGLELAHQARRQFPHLPIVVVSGGHSPSSNELPAGATFLAKPYNVSDLVNALHPAPNAVAA